MVTASTSGILSSRILARRFRRPAQRRMPQALPDRHDVGAVLERVSRKAVPQPRLDCLQALGIKRYTLGNRGDNAPE
jgi:hypothetical protein